MEKNDEKSKQLQLVINDSTNGKSWKNQLRSD
jgi:hypothetical protein